MSVPPSTAESNQPRRFALSGGWLAAIAAGTLVGAFLCGGMLVALIYMTAVRGKKSLESGVLAQTGVLPTLPVRQAPVNDWWTSRVLSEVYATALDAVVVDPQVIEQLGEPVNADFESEEIFRRADTGELGKAETIRFDIIGPRGRAEVTVVVVGSAEAMGLGGSQLAIEAVEVETADGTIVEVPPPAMQPFTPR